MQKIVIINGPNLNLLGIREPALYGKLTMEEIMTNIQNMFPHIDFTYKQSNHEGDLIDWIQQYAICSPTCTGIVINAGGYSHTSISLRDAITCSSIPIVEVHITDPSKRETFRHKSLLTQVCNYTIMGKGTKGYHLAVEWILNLPNIKT